MRTKSAMWGTIVALAISLPFANPQKDVIITGDRVVVERLLLGTTSIPINEIVAIEEVQVKTVSTLVIRTSSGKAYGINVQGQRLTKMGEALSNHLGFKYHPNGHLKRWSMD